MDNSVVGRGASGEAGCWACSLLCRVPFHPRHAGATAAARPTTHHRHRHGTLRRATVGGGWRPRAMGSPHWDGGRPTYPFPPYPLSAWGAAAAPRSCTDWGSALVWQGRGARPTVVVRAGTRTRWTRGVRVGRWGSTLGRGSTPKAQRTDVPSRQNPLGRSTHSSSVQWGGLVGTASIRNHSPVPVTVMETCRRAASTVGGDRPGR